VRLPYIDVDRVSGLDQLIGVVHGYQSHTRHDVPVLGPKAMSLVAQAPARTHTDAFDLEAGSSVEYLVVAPGALIASLGHSHQISPFATPAARPGDFPAS
jgi:hypothetical protein